MTAITDASVGVKNPNTIPPTIMRGVINASVACATAETNSWKELGA